MDSPQIEMFKEKAEDAIEKVMAQNPLEHFQEMFYNRPQINLM